MEKIKSYATAVLKVSEKVLLIGIGLAGLWAVNAKIKDESLSKITLIVAATAMTFGLIPLVFSYIKAVWPTKTKEVK